VPEVTKIPAAKILEKFFSLAIREKFNVITVMAPTPLLTFISDINAVIKNAPTTINPKPKKVGVVIDAIIARSFYPCTPFNTNQHS